MSTWEKVVKPDYERKCITRISSTVKSLLSVNNKGTLLNGKSERVLLIVIDSLGYENLMRISKEKKELEESINSFKLQKITTVFPTSTATALTSMESGRTPEEHSVLGWMMYSRQLNMRFFPLKFQAVDEKEAQKFEEKAYKGLVEHESLFKDLSNEVEVYRILPESIIDSPYSETKKGHKKGYSNLVEAFVKTRKLIEENKGNFFYLYLPQFDTSEHHHAPYSEESTSLVREIFHLIHREIIEKLKDLQILITADHGCVKVENKVQIKEDNPLGEIIYPNLRTYQGKKILPSGEPRNMYLHIKEGMVERVIEELQKKLKSKARVFKTHELIEKNLFGSGNPSQSFLERIGNITILPKKNTILCFGPYLASKDKGMHGGLTKEEMYVPFLSKKI